MRTPWQRTDHSGAPGGGGVMAMMKGRVFEKVGVHVSTVFGEFAPEFRKEIPGAAEDPRFFASGISLIAHMHNPACAGRPHEYALRRHDQILVRRRRRSDAGARAPPHARTIPTAIAFHAAMKAACDAHAAVAPYDKFKTWCDEYFFLKHRGEMRGIGGIFYDWLDSGDFDADFAFTQDVGRAFLGIYPELVRRNFNKALDRSGARGAAHPPRAATSSSTCFTTAAPSSACAPAAMSESILSSMPPVVKWP